MNRIPVVARFYVAAASLAMLGLSLAVPTRAARAEDGVTREFPEKNFKWTVPAKWEFVEPPEADKNVGFVINAKRTLSPGVEVTAYVSVADGGSTSVEAEFTTAREGKLRNLTDTSVEEGQVNWSGAAGARRMTIKGKASNGSRIAWFTYGGIVNSKYHQLDLRSSNGAYNDLVTEIADVVKGYQFLEGAMAEEVPPPAGMDGEPGMEGDAAGGPPKPLRFEKLALTWNLPAKLPVVEGKVVKMLIDSRALNSDKSKSEMIGGLALEIDSEQVVTVILAIQPEQVGQTPIAFVKEESNFKDEAARMDGSAIPELDESVKLGNWHGAMRGTSGKSKEDGKHLVIRNYFAVLHGVIWKVILTTHDKAEQTHKEWVKAALAGLTWDDADEGIRGPWSTPFPSYTSQRSDSIDAGKKVKFEHSVLKLTKGEKFARLKFTATNAAFATWVFAAEARDTDAYCFIGIERFDAAELLKQKKEPDSLIDEHESEFKNEFEDSVTAVKGKNRKAASWKTATGSSYEFKGTKEKRPWVERGWVVKKGQIVFRVRVLYGGSAAEAKLQADADKLIASLQFS